MAFSGSRIQSLAYALGSAKQADVATASATFNRFRKLDMGMPFLAYGTETDKDEIGKGNEFINQVFPTNWDFGGRAEKYGSAEFVLWAWAYALGNVGLATSLYTINPIDPGVTLELPYFSIVAQQPEGGGMAVDEMYVGNAVESVETTFAYGPGRNSVKTVCDYVGTGQHTIPSAVTLPATLTENYMLGGGISAVTINGVNYLSTQRVLRGSLGWKNNLILPLRFLPGDGLVSNSMIGKRLLIGSRVPTFSFTAFLTHTSTEFSLLTSQTSGTATVTFTYDATHYVTFTYHNVSFESVVREQEEGLVAVTVNVAPKWDFTGTPANGVLTITGKAGIVDIAQ